MCRWKVSLGVSVTAYQIHGYSSFVLPILHRNFSEWNCSKCNYFDFCCPVYEPYCKILPCWFLDNKVVVWKRFSLQKSIMVLILHVIFTVSTNYYTSIFCLKINKYKNLSFINAFLNTIFDICSHILTTTYSSLLGLLIEVPFIPCRYKQHGLACFCSLRCGQAETSLNFKKLRYPSPCICFAYTLFKILERIIT